MKRIAIFASGEGTNARNIINYFRNNREIKVECLVSNNSKAKVLNAAIELNVHYFIITRNDLYESERVIGILQRRKIDLIVLAGFLWMIPQNMLDNFPKRIINIHPALLPKYGGANMYGNRVHEAVVASRERESGITIHYLNERYDEGEILFQKKISLDEHDSAEAVAQKVRLLEYEWYPRIIESILKEDEK